MRESAHRLGYVKLEQPKHEKLSKALSPSQQNRVKTGERNRFEGKVFQKLPLVAIKTKFKKKLNHSPKADNAYENIFSAKSY